LLAYRAASLALSEPRVKPPNVILEDIDAVERRRLKQRGRKYSIRDLFVRPTEDDPRPFRHLMRFVKPHKAALLAALCMSAVSAAAKLSSVFITKDLLEAILTGAYDPQPVAASLRFAARTLRAAAMQDTWAGLLAPLRAPFALVAWYWEGLTPRQQLGVAACSFVALVLVEQCNKYAQKLLMRTVTLRIVNEVRLALFEKLMTFSMRFYQANHSGRLMSRLTGDLHGFGVLLVDVVVDITTDLFTLIGGLIYLYYLGGWAVLAGLGIALISFVPVQQISRRLRRKEIGNQSKLASLFINLSEVFSAQKVVKAFGGEAYEQERFRRASEEYVQGQMKSADLRARVQPVVDSTGAIGIAILMWLGGLQVLKGIWKPADFLTIIILLVNNVASMRRLGDTNSKLHGGLSSADRVATILFADPEIVDAPDAVELNGFQRGLSFRDVRYDHDPANPVLRDVTFELHKGQTLAVVGPTGSGKTTLADLIPRFYDVQGGEVLIDGLDLRKVKLASLRRLITMVTQDTVLFRDTIRANIAYARPETPMEDVVAAAKAANAHDFIMRLPQGYDTVVGERGLTLSGGERQRVAIARALLKDAPILILDEATSALDSASEALVQQAITNLKAGRTTIVIAHRLSTVRDADQILVLERGRIVETGGHNALLRKGGLYAEMVKIQQA
jgi:ATP-binding cassette, subfamily B, bacterial MsbA